MSVKAGRETAVSSPGHTTVRAMVLMVLASSTGPAMQSIVRIVASSGMHPFEVVFFRNLMALAFLLPFFLRRGFRGLRTRRPGVHLIRGVLQVIAMMMNWFALTLVPLADVTALLFSSPIFASLGAIFFLGERSQLRRWVAIFLGAVGMFVIVRPGAQDLDLGVTLVLTASLLFAVTRLLVKDLAREDTTTTIVMLMALITTPISFIPALFVWTWPGPDMIVLLIGISGLGTLTHLLSTQALREGDLTVLEPLGFTRLIWATLFGFFLFSEVPVVWTWLGSAIIVVSTTVLIRAEMRDRTIGIEIE